MKQNHFSLVELLIVISLFGVLISLLSPSLQSIYQSSEKILCQNNLKEIVLAEHHHGEDYGGFFSPHLVQKNEHPFGFHWYRNNYLKSYFTENTIPGCPQDPPWTKLSRAKGYGRNIAIIYLKDRADKAINLNNPSLEPYKKAIVSDGTMHFISALGVSDQRGWLNHGEQSLRAAAFRHLNTANAAFFDGHTESLDLAEHVDNETHI